MPSPNGPAPPTNGRRRGPIVLLVLWVVALAGLGLYADGWSTDNRIERWGSQLDRDVSWEVLRDRFGGDEAVLVRLGGFGVEDAAAQAFAEQLGAELPKQAAVEDVVSPLSLLNRWPWPVTEPATNLERLVRGLDLQADGPPRIDFVLRIALGATPAERADLARSLDDLRERAKAAGLGLRYAGHPLVSAALDDEARRVERTFVPLLVLLAALGAWAFLRSVPLVAVALLPAATASVGSRAAARAFIGPSDLILVAVGPITFVLLLAGTLHVVLRFQHHVGAGMAPREAARAALLDKRLGCSLAALTTAIGFAVFRISALRSVADLGTLAAAAVLVVTPLSLFGSTYLLGALRSSRGSATASARPWRKLAAFVARRRGLFACAAIAVLVAGASTPTFLQTATDGLTYFAADHPVRVQFESLEAEGAGLSSAEVMIERKDESAWTVSQLASLELARALLAAPGATHVVGPELILDTIASGAGRLAAMPLLRKAGRLDESGKIARWTVRFPNGESEQTDALLAALHGVADARVPEGTAYVSGSLVRLHEVQATLVGTLARSLGLTLIATTILFLIVVRSARELLAALMVNLVPVAVILVAAVALGIPLDGATTMVAAVVLGLAVDNTFHLLHAAGPMPRTPRSRLHAFAEVGGAATVSSFSLALGFGTLLLSGFAPTSRFGGLCAIGAVAAWAADLLVLPALLPWRSQRRG
ncbi:MMPL family protein [Planctomycetes bacterium Poly30]|uniref:MMPL family protein n=1 Tax=Saltatorellus ferox TaxID=2528018 RepID=A0A518ENY4_9BACT|nr:MMPL family protein [Planctomycetes bacterium Poly30]